MPVVKILKLKIKNFKLILMHKLLKKLNLVLGRYSVRNYPCTSFFLICAVGFWFCDHYWLIVPAPDDR
jgi:hypothetical protein